jgi:hypothetical protein
MAVHTDISVFGPFRLVSGVLTVGLAVLAAAAAAGGAFLAASRAPAPELELAAALGGAAAAAAAVLPIQLGLVWLSWWLGRRAVGRAARALAPPVWRAHLLQALLESLCAAAAAGGGGLLGARRAPAGEGAALAAAGAAIGAAVGAAILGPLVALPAAIRAECLLIGLTAARLLEGDRARLIGDRADDASGLLEAPLPGGGGAPRPPTDRGTAEPESEALSVYGFARRVVALVIAAQATIAAAAAAGGACLAAAEAPASGARLAAALGGAAGGAAAALPFQLCAAWLVQWLVRLKVERALAYEAGAHHWGLPPAAEGPWPAGRAARGPATPARWTHLLQVLVECLCAAAAAGGGGLLGARWAPAGGVAAFAAAGASVGGAVGGALLGAVAATPVSAGLLLFVAGVLAAGRLEEDRARLVGGDAAPAAGGCPDPAPMRGGGLAAQEPAFV